MFIILNKNVGLLSCRANISKIRNTSQSDAEKLVNNELQ